MTNDICHGVTNIKKIDIHDKVRDVKNWDSYEFERDISQDSLKNVTYMTNITNLTEVTNISNMTKSTYVTNMKF